eukprot:CAMPEP_0198249448 /NCGR_PEP_ID=MMETSP1447-20131203/977_1 /TAXON_ID=420782 /ORGANISM="Chaetoceros dichaeta, Strain CCMP1751" /LENGTH=71 /DNA_ID=CAMNT_0043934091 /DNA_START=105 /DNA_END=317 /DNA_ORIENTATION=+
MTIALPSAPPLEPDIHVEPDVHVSPEAVPVVQATLVPGSYVQPQMKTHIPSGATKTKTSHPPPGVAEGGVW